MKAFALIQATRQMHSHSHTHTPQSTKLQNRKANTRHFHRTKRLVALNDWISRIQQCFRSVLLLWSRVRAFSLSCVFRVASTAPLPSLMQAFVQSAYCFSHPNWFHTMKNNNSKEICGAVLHLLRVNGTGIGWEARFRSYAYSFSVFVHRAFVQAVCVAVDVYMPIRERLEGAVTRERPK